MTKTTVPLPLYITLRLDLLSGLMKDIAEFAHQKRDGVSVREVRLLLQISDNPRLTMSRLVELSFMEKTMVSKAVTSLTRAGLVVRHIDAGDARKVSLELTRKGKGAADRARTYVQTATDNIMSILTPKQRTAFDDALGLLTEQVLKQRDKGLDLLGNPFSDEKQSTSSPPHTAKRTFTKVINDAQAASTATPISPQKSGKKPTQASNANARAFGSSKRSKATASVPDATTKKRKTPGKDGSSAVG